MLRLFFGRLVARYRRNRRLSRIVRDANRIFGRWAIGTDAHFRYIAERAYLEYAMPADERDLPGADVRNPFDGDWLDAHKRAYGEATRFGWNARVEPSDTSRHARRRL